MDKENFVNLYLVKCCVANIKEYKNIQEGNNDAFKEKLIIYLLESAKSMSLTTSHYTFYIYE